MIPYSERLRPMSLKKLYFVDAEGKHHFVQQGCDLKNLSVARQQDMKNRGFKPEPYIRSWFADGGQWIDFGSWSCFYFIEGATIEDTMKEESL